MQMLSNAVVEVCSLEDVVRGKECLDLGGDLVARSPSIASIVV
jgi:hypothetical protein